MSDRDSVSSAPEKRVYLDLCALNRPLDDQDQMRVRLEADAVSLIISDVRARTLSLVASPVHFVEAQRIPIRPSAPTSSFCLAKSVRQ